MPRVKMCGGLWSSGAAHGARFRLLHLFCPCQAGFTRPAPPVAWTSSGKERAIWRAETRFPSTTSSVSTGRTYLPVGAEVEFNLRRGTAPLHTPPASTSPFCPDAGGSPRADTGVFRLEINGGSGGGVPRPRPG